MFSAELPLSSLIELCRALRHNLSAGMSLVKVFQQQGERGPLPLRPVATRLSARLETGDSLELALKPEKEYFPPLFVSMASVGERSGNLPEIFAELEKYFALRLRLWRQFMGQITVPLLQLGAAIFVLTIMLYLLGIVAEMTGSTPIDPFGIGTGIQGALTFLGLTVGVVGGLFAVYLVATRAFKQQPVIDGYLLRVPVVGRCLHALALARFCIAFRLTLETGMSILSAVRLSLRGTGNSAYAARTSAVVDCLRDGDSVTEALLAAELFPSEFLDMVAVAEEGGRLSEMLQHQANYYEEESARRLKALTSAFGFFVWGTVALLMIVAIVRLYQVAYLGQIEKMGL